MASIEKVKECAETHRGRLARVTFDTFKGFRDSPWGIIVGFTSGEKPRVVIQIGDKDPEAREPWDVAHFYDLTWAMIVGRKVILAEPGALTVHDTIGRGLWDLITPGAEGNLLRLKAFWGEAIAKSAEWRRPVILDEVEPAPPKDHRTSIKAELPELPEAQKWHVLEQAPVHYRFMTLHCPKPGLASIVGDIAPNPIKGLPEPCARCYTESLDFDHTCGGAK